MSQMEENDNLKEQEQKLLQDVADYYNLGDKKGDPAFQVLIMRNNEYLRISEDCTQLFFSPSKNIIESDESILFTPHFFPKKIEKTREDLLAKGEDGVDFLKIVMHLLIEGFKEEFPDSINTASFIQLIEDNYRNLTLFPGTIQLIDEDKPLSINNIKFSLDCSRSSILDKTLSAQFVPEYFSDDDEESEEEEED